MPSVKSRDVCFCSRAETCLQRSRMVRTNCSMPSGAAVGPAARASSAKTTSSGPSSTRSPVRPKILAERWPNRSAVEVAAGPAQRVWRRAGASRPPLHARSSCNVEVRWRSTRGRQSMPRRFLACWRARCRPSHLPRQALWWTPRIHLLLFVHRVTGVAPGLYLFGRASAGFERLQREIRSHDMREPAHDSLPLVCLGRGDCRSLARRLSCDQDIASDGCFSLGMIADFDASLAEYGRSFYRHLFWESGLVGQILYLEAEAARREGDWHWLLLRRSRARGARPEESRVSEPLPLHGRRPGGRYAPHDRTGIRVGLNQVHGCARCAGAPEHPCPCTRAVHPWT